MASNATGSSEILVSNGLTSDYMGYPSVTALSDGSWLVTWISHYDFDSEEDAYDRLWLQHYDASGVGDGVSNPLAVSVPISGASLEYNAPAVSALSDGGWVMAYGSYDDISYAYSDGGSIQFFGESVNTYQTGEQTDASIAVLSDGGWLITWESNGQDSENGGIYQQRYDAGGAKIGDETFVNATTSSYGIAPVVAALNDGGWVVAWTGDDDIRLQRFDSDGNTVDGEVTVSTEGIFYPNLSITAISGGGWVITWDANSYNIYQQIYAADGSPVGTITMVNTHIYDETEDDGHYSPSVAALAGGGWIVAWESSGQDGDGYGIYQQRYAADGTMIGDETLVNITTAGYQLNPTVAALTDGGWVVTWEVDGQIYQRHFAVDIEGTALADTLTGTSWSETLRGGDGNDIIDGKGGDDVMIGGGGNDTYIVDSTGDTVDETGGSGTDLVKSSVSWTLGTGLEKLTLTGSGDIDAQGNSSNNALTGNSGRNTMRGGDGNDTLDGKGGNDTMYGGAGNDTYVVDSTGDKVDETGGSGTDLVNASVSWTLGAGIENLTLTGSSTINGTGNSSSNTLRGNSAANVLDGKSGNDTMYGGAGSDTYVVDSTGDKVDETGGSGTDLVKSSVSWTLGTGFENLTLTGSSSINGNGNGGANVLRGNSAANILDGKSGNDTMYGGAGNDTYVVDSTGDKVDETGGSGTDLVKSAVSWTLGAGVENLTLTGSSSISGTGNSAGNTLLGNSRNNTLRGLDGNDKLNGGAGADKMYGGSGNDTYYVDNTGDIVSDSSGSADKIYSSISLSLQASEGLHFAGDGVERLTLTGSANLQGYGNEASNILTGNSGNNVLRGFKGNDTLIGGAGNDTLRGGSGSDKLDGGTGSDTAEYSDATNGVVANLSNASKNTGYADGDTFVSIENLVGSSHADTLTGTSGANAIEGGRGADKLYGLGGNDKFVYRSVLDSSLTSMDTIYDMTSSDDIDLRRIDASTAKTGDQAFKFIGTNAFSGSAGELRYDKMASDTYVYADTNGDGKADLAIHLDDPIKLTSGYFLL